MSKLTESAIEDFAIKLFERLGYSYVYAPDGHLAAQTDERQGAGGTDAGYARQEV